MEGGEGGSQYDGSDKPKWIIVEGKRLDLPPLDISMPVTGAPKPRPVERIVAPTLDEEARRELPSIDTDFAKVLPADPRYEGDTLKVMGENGPVYAYHKPTEEQRAKDPDYSSFTRIADSLADYQENRLYPQTPPPSEVTPETKKETGGNIVNRFLNRFK
jgi:hypothetical protein